MKTRGNRELSEMEIEAVYIAIDDAVGEKSTDPAVTDLLKKAREKLCGATKVVISGWKMSVMTKIPKMIKKGRKSLLVFSFFFLYFLVLPASQAAT